MNVNRVVLAGNLTADPEVLEGKESGKKFAKLRLAVNSRKKVGEEWQEVPGFYDVAVFGKQAQAAAEHLKKGSLVAVDGRLEWREFEHEGQKRQAISVVAESLQFGPRAAQTGAQERTQDAEPEPAAEESGSGSDDW